MKPIATAFAISMKNADSTAAIVWTARTTTSAGPSPPSLQSCMPISDIAKKTFREKSDMSASARERVGHSSLENRRVDMLLRRSVRPFQKADRIVERIVGPVNE